jgi:phage-related protein
MSAEQSTLLIVMEARDNASASLDLFESKIRELSAEMEKASVQISAASDKIDESFAKTAAESEALSEATKTLGRNLDDNSKHLESNGKSMSSTGEKASELAGKIRLIALAAGALSGPLAGLLALGPLAIFGGMAIGAAALSKSLKEAQASGQQLTATQKQLLPVMKELNAAFAPVDQAAKGAFTEILNVVKSLAPELTLVGQAMAPMVGILGGALGGVVDQLVRPLSQMMPSLLPVVIALGNGLVTLAKGLAGLFTNLNIAQAAQGLNALFNTVGMILPVIGKLLSALAPLSNVILGTLVPAVGKMIVTFGNALMPVLQAITPIIGPLAGTIVTLAETFGKVLTAAAPLITPLLSIVLAFSNFDTTLEALSPLFSAIATALGPILKLVAQVANVVANSLNTAFAELATALIPLIPPLGLLASTILGALVQVFNALLPILPTLVQAFIGLLPGVVALIGPLTAIVRALTPIVVIAAKIFTAIVDWIIGPLDKLKPILPYILGAILAFMAVKQVITIIQGIGTAFRVLTLIMATNPFIAIAIAIVALAILIYTHWDQIKQYFFDAWHWINNTARDVWGDIEKFFKGLWNDITKIFDDAVKDVENIIRGWYPLILGILSGGILLIPALVYKYWSQITHYVSEAWDDAINWIKGVPGKILNIFIKANTWLLNIGKDIINGLWKGIQDAVGGLLSNIGGLGNTIVGAFKDVLSIFSPSQVMADEVGKFIPAGIAKGMLDNVGAIQAAANVLGRHTVTSSLVGLQGVGSSLAVGAASAGSAAGGDTIFDFRGGTYMSDKDIDMLVQKIGKRTATVTFPSGGLRVKM